MKVLVKKNDYAISKRETQLNKFTAFALLFVTLSSFSQQFLIKNVRLFDGEKVVENTSVLVQDGRIKTISTEILGAFEIIDGTGKTLIPALTNSHVHAFSIASLNEAAKAGVLNLLDMHGVEMMQGMMKSYNDSINYANYYVAGAAATVPKGHGTQFGFPTPTLTRPDQAAKFINDRVEAGADFIKIILEPWKATLSYETVRSLILEAHKKQKVVVVHVSKVADALEVLNHDADGLVHLWWDKKMTEIQLEQLSKEKDFFIIPTLLTSVKVLESIRKNSPTGTFLSNDELRSEVKRLFDAGVPILAGTDPPNAQINYGTDLYKELYLLSEAGIPNLEVLKAATSLPIKKFKLGQKGMIKEGYPADLVLIEGNPLDEIKALENIKAVWKAGKNVPLK